MRTTLAQQSFLPDYISGDFDSIKPEVKEFYKNKVVLTIYKGPDHFHYDPYLYPPL
ncbi:UNVERIFIED_CONTAM: hypothetical protein FKN15_011476 [Acipenser sinensis]